MKIISFALIILLQVVGVVGAKGGGIYNLKGKLKKKKYAIGLRIFSKNRVESLSLFKWMNLLK